MFAEYFIKKWVEKDELPLLQMAYLENEATPFSLEERDARLTWHYADHYMHYEYDQCHQLSGSQAYYFACKQERASEDFSGIISIIIIYWE